MAQAVELRTDYTAAELRRLAASSRHANQSRRLLSLAAVVDGMNRTQSGADRRHGRSDAARLGASLQRAWGRMG